MKSICTIRDVITFILCGITVFSLSFLRSWHISDVSIRNATAIILFLSAFIFRNKITIKDSCVKWYIIWLFFYIIVNIITGYIGETNFYKNLIGYHMVSLFLIYSLPRLVITSKSLKYIIISFSLFYLFNSFLTIFQFNNNSLAWTIGEYISPMNEEKMERMEYLSSNVDNMLFYSICSGLNGFVVTNGQFIACFAPIISIMIIKPNIKNKFYGAVILAIILFTGWCVQQRMCFWVLLFNCLILCYFSVCSIWKTVLFIFILVMLLFLCFYDSIIIEDFGRILDFSDNERIHTWEYLEMFCSNFEYVFLGHCTVDGLEDNKIFLTLGHNSFLDSMRRGGLFCLLIFVYLVFKIITKCVSILKHSIHCNDFITIGLCLSVLFNLTYSMTHSDGIPSGSVFFWGAYSLLISSYRINKDRLENYK